MDASPKMLEAIAASIPLVIQALFDVVADPDASVAHRMKAIRLLLRLFPDGWVGE